MRGLVEDEVDHREQREVRTHGIEPVGQRHDGEHQTRCHAEPVEQPAAKSLGSSFASLRTLAVIARRRAALAASPHGRRLCPVRRGCRARRCRRRCRRGAAVACAGGGGASSLRTAGCEPGEQHLAITVESAVGRASTSANVAAGALDLDDLRHRITRREYAAHAGRQQQVAGLAGRPSTVTNGSDSLPDRRCRRRSCARRCDSTAPGSHAPHR